MDFSTYPDSISAILVFLYSYLQAQARRFGPSPALWDYATLSAAVVAVYFRLNQLVFVPKEARHVSLIDS
jgi:hypothetical protein